MSQAAWRTCEVCGHAALEPEVRPSLVRYPPAADGKVVWDDVVRCRDVEACKARTAAKGAAWPFDDAREPKPYVARAPER